MRIIQRATLILSLCVAPVLCQTSSTTNKPLPPGFVDGSKNPTLIPDVVAYRLVFMSLTLKAPGDAKAIAKQGALLAQIGLLASDLTTVKNTMAAFSNSYATTAGLPVVGNVPGSPSVGVGVSTLVQQYQGLLFSSLSTDGVTKLVTFVQAAKARMVVKL
jgi:hypothetical protein